MARECTNQRFMMLTDDGGYESHDEEAHEVQEEYGEIEKNSDSQQPGSDTI